MEQYIEEEIYEEEYDEVSSFSKIWKVLKYILIILVMVLIVFFLIRKSGNPIIEDNTSSSKNIFTQEYIVQNDLTTDEKVY